MRLLAGRGALIPYAALEREIDVDEDFERYGLAPGRCSCWGNTPRSARELMYLGGAARNSFNDDFSRETRFFAHLQIEF